MELIQTHFNEKESKNIKDQLFISPTSLLICNKKKINPQDPYSSFDQRFVSVQAGSLPDDEPDLAIEETLSRHEQEKLDKVPDLEDLFTPGQIVHK